MKYNFRSSETLMRFPESLINFPSSSQVLAALHCRDNSIILLVLTVYHYLSSKDSLESRHRSDTRHTLIKQRTSFSGYLPQVLVRE